MAVWREKHEPLWEPRAERLPQSWERSSAIGEVSREELTPELCLGGLCRNSSIVVIAEG